MWYGAIIIVVLCCRSFFLSSSSTTTYVPGLFSPFLSRTHAFKFISFSVPLVILLMIHKSHSNVISIVIVHPCHFCYLKPFLFLLFWSWSLSFSRLVFFVVIFYSLVHRNILWGTYVACCSFSKPPLSIFSEMST